MSWLIQWLPLLWIALPHCAEPTPPPVTEETDCADGIDNDGDSLVDCEDGDCAAACVEADCGDELDNDGDGLIDCEDEDCWDLGSCDFAVTTIHGGAMVHRLQHHFDGRWSETIRLYADDYFTSSVALYSVRGSAALWAADSSTWVSCDWSFERGSFQRQQHRVTIPYSVTYIDASTESLTRSGLTVSEGCPIATSAFLPRSLTIDRSQVLASGVARYQGLITTNDQHLYSEIHRGDSGVGWGSSFLKTTTWRTNPLDPGGTHTASMAAP